jgi:hypothetical protein
MSLANPVFIPGPTNMPEELRQACDMPTLDHRSPMFKDFLLPALAGVKRILKTTKGEAIIFPCHWYGWLGSGDHKHADCRRQGSGRTPRHVLASLDRYVRAPWARHARG